MVGNRMILQTYHSTCVEETEKFAQELAKTLHAGDVLAFCGELGAGKTAFTRGLAKGLRVRGEVSSPTFALVHEYPGAAGGVSLYHFDMYRVTSSDDLYSTGYYDYLEAGGILAIEWSENIKEELPAQTLFVTLTVLSETERSIVVERKELS